MYQHYLAPGFRTMGRVYERMEELARTDGDGAFQNLARILSINEDLLLATVEKILPMTERYALSRLVGGGSGDVDPVELFSDEGRVRKLEADISNAIKLLAGGERGVQQGDERISNIGIKDGNFAMFDYNGATDANVGVSRGRLQQSIRGVQAKLGVTETKF